MDANRTLRGDLIIDWSADTDIRLVSNGDKPGYDRVVLGDAISLWPEYVRTDDAAAIAACDRLIEALQELRARALTRLAALEPVEAVS